MSKFVKYLAVSAILMLVVAACQPAANAPTSVATTSSGPSVETTPTSEVPGTSAATSSASTEGTSMPSPLGTPVPLSTGSAGQATAVGTSSTSTGDLGTCIVGSWQMADFRPFFDSLMTANPQLPASLTNVSGTITDTFSADGTARTVASNWTATLSAVGQTVSMLVNGNGDATYSVSGNQIIGSPAAGSSLTATLTVNGQPFTAMTPAQLGAPAGINGTFDARCTADTLYLTPVVPNLPAGTTLQPMVLTRVK